MWGWIALLVAAAGCAGWVWSERRRRIVQSELKRTLQLFEVSLEINSSIRKQELLQRIMDTSARVLQAEASSVILVDPQTDELYFELATGEKGDEVREIRLKKGEGIAGWVAEHGVPVKIDDAARDPRWSSKVAVRVSYPTRNLLCVPIFSKGAIIGVLQVLNKRGRKPFSDKDVRLLESIAAPTAVSLENAMLLDALEKTVAAKERMESELRIAQRIQLGFLPQTLSLRRSGGAIWQEPSPTEGGGNVQGAALFPKPQRFAADVHAELRAAREVGGDFYDYFMLDERELFFALGDVSDKGIPAALYMAMTLTLLKGKVTAGMSPADLLTAVNRELYRDDSTMFATIFCGVLNVETGELLCSEGGHCTPYIVSADGEVRPLAAAKRLPLGVMEETVYAETRLSLRAGERIVLYTDGITEAEDVEGRQFGARRLEQRLADSREGHGSEWIRSIVADVDAFTAGALQFDDMAIMIVEKT